MESHCDPRVTSLSGYADKPCMRCGPLYLTPRSNNVERARTRIKYLSEYLVRFLSKLLHHRHHDIRPTYSTSLSASRRNPWEKEISKYCTSRNITYRTLPNDSLLLTQERPFSTFLHLKAPSSSRRADSLPQHPLGTSALLAWRKGSSRSSLAPEHPDPAWVGFLHRWVQILLAGAKLPILQIPFSLEPLEEAQPHE